MENKQMDDDEIEYIRTTDRKESTSKMVVLGHTPYIDEVRNDDRTGNSGTHK